MNQTLHCTSCQKRFKNNHNLKGQIGKFSDILQSFVRHNLYLLLSKGDWQWNKVIGLNRAALILSSVLIKKSPCLKLKAKTGYRVVPWVWVLCSKKVWWPQWSFCAKVQLGLKSVEQGIFSYILQSELYCTELYSTVLNYTVLYNIVLVGTPL